MMRRLGVRRLGTWLAGSTLAVALAGCGILDAPPSAEVPAGCGDCASEVADLVGELESTGAVLSVEGTRRTTTSSGFLGLGVELDGADVVSADMGALLDTVAEAAWRSGVTPLDRLSVDGTLRDGYTETMVYDFGGDRASYEDRWGDRPEGSEWTPVADGDDDLEGCEVDGCHDLMRDIAREASALPGVEAVVRADYVADTPTNAASADVDLRAAGDEVTEDAAQELAEDVAEIVWRSEVGPIDLISVTVETADGGFPQTVDYQIDAADGRDHDRLEQQWGPRSVDG